MLKPETQSWNSRATGLPLVKGGGPGPSTEKDTLPERLYEGQRYSMPRGCVTIGVSSRILTAAAVLSKKHLKEQLREQPGESGLHSLG